jgi:VIT1/CCC1 family predicted Fe2+/Mn2+ transporter
METVFLNMRWAGYLLIAIGLINWRYQDSFEKGAPIWIFGLALIIGTYIPVVSKFLATKVGTAIAAVAVVLLLVLAFTA